MSPTKQAKSKATVARNQNSIRWLNGEKNLGRTQAQSGASSPLASSPSIQTNWIETLREFVHFHLFGSWSNHASLETRCWGSVPMAVVSMRMSRDGSRCRSTIEGPILLLMYQVHQDLWDVFLVPADLNNAA